jgi:pyruvate ferredoxin oxidoreductase delta subunit
MSKMHIDKSTPVEDLTPGGIIYQAANALEFKTGDWRSEKPIWIPEKCKQCGLCFPVCPDDAIPVNKEQNRTDFNYDYCKGCGICSKVCPFAAIEMKEEGGNE